MTRITERSSAYPSGVLRPSFTIEGTRFYPAFTREGTVGCLNGYDDWRGGVVPVGGSLELAYEPYPGGEEETR